MKLIVHRGTHEIGGSVIELISGKSRIILDVGLPLVTKDREPFDATQVERKSIDELLQDGTAPNVPGLFAEGEPPDAILVSHCHLDHVGLLHLTRSTIPIYASRGTSKLMLVGAVFSRRKELDRNRHRELVPGQTVTIGDFQVTPFAVDHSAFGSLAMLIEAEGKTILYSGDIRQHGRKPGMAKSLLKFVSQRKIDLLLIEGTHFGSGRESGLTEHELEENIVGLVREAPGLVLTCFSPIDVDRLITYYRASLRSGRTFVADAYTAFVLHLIASEAKIPRPTTKRGIRVFFNYAFDRKNIETLKQRFEPNRIDLGEVLANPKKHLMVFRPTMTKLDFNGQIPTQSRCLFSYWAGYLTKPDWVDLQKQLTQVGGDFVPAHTSGHIYINDLIEFVRDVNPVHVVPIHTFEPQRFSEHFSNVVLLMDGQVHAF